MSKYTTQSKSIQIVKAFKHSNASLALYAKHSLNESNFYFSDRFRQRMLNINPKLLSKLSFNVHCNSDTPWRYPGGMALTMNATAKAHMSSNKKRPYWTRPLDVDTLGGKIQNIFYLYFGLLPMYK